MITCTHPCLGNALIRRLVRIGVLDETRMRLDYVLALKIEDFLERRLQTQVHPFMSLKGTFQLSSYLFLLGLQIRIGQVNPPCSCLDQTATHPVGPVYHQYTTILIDSV